MNRQGISLEEIYQETAELIPPGWQYPEITCARILIEGEVYEKTNFKEALWKQWGAIDVDGQRAGFVEVGYLEERPEADEGPFIKDERNLIHAIAEQLGNITERKRAEEKLNQQYMRMALLNRITRTVAERQDPESVFLVMLQHLEDYLTVDFGCIALFDQIKESLCVSSIGPKSRSPAGTMGLEQGTQISVEQNGLGRCKQGETLYEPDTARVNRPMLKKFSQAAMRSLLVSPITVEDKLIGVLFVGRRSAGAFSSGESEFLRQLCEHTALAVKQKRLYEELEGAYNEIRETQKVVMEQERLRALGQMASGYSP